MNLEGRLIGNRYEIIEKIGNGGMATVYKAKCRVLNRYVAVKVLKEEFTTDEEFIKRFNIEAQSAASLTHPNIVSVYDVGSEGNLYYIVMELVKGRTLKEIIVEDGALSWKWSVNVAIQIASALETAHKNNIIHRDIKPHNIIITEEGIAKVTDFGIAKAVSNSTITTFGATIGSVHYFSPEHARGGYTDAKSDLYSLGVVMYEMLTGKVPFDADTPVSVALKQMQEKPIEPKLINSAIPDSVNRIVLKAMKKDVGLRYSNATEMLKDLSLALKNPDGNFVKINNGNDFPTQTVSTVYNENTVKRNPNNKKKKSKFATFINKHKVLSVFIGLILLFTISLGGTYLALTAGQLKDVQIPELVGLSAEEAQKTAQEVGLKYEVLEEKFDSEVPAGFIISQDPAYIENYTIKEQSIIKVIVSKGQEIVTVPKVVGMEKEEAKTTLEDLGLVVEIVEETSKKVEEGYVIKQSVEEKKEINAGETITITVSSGTGIEQVQVPNLVNKTEEEAKKLITSSGLTLKEVVEIEDSTKNNGTVLKQDLEVGSTVDKDTGITITVNRLPEVKNGTVKVNVKSITGYKVEKDEEGNEIKPEKVELKIMVGNDIVYREKVDPTSTEISQSISGIGNVTIKVYIDDILKKSGTLNLNTSNVYTAE